MLLTALALTGGVLYVGAQLRDAYLSPPPSEPEPEPAASGSEPEPGEPRAQDEAASPRKAASAASEAGARPEPDSDEESEGSSESTRESEEEINRYLIIACTSAALALLGLLTTPLLGICSALLTIYSCMPIFRGAYHAIIHERKPRIAILDAVATVTILLAGYYFAGALANALYYIGRKLLLKTQDRSRKQLLHIFGEIPRIAWVLRDGVEVEVPLEQVKETDTVVVYAGQVVPVDGVMIEGAASFDQHMLTGESQLVEKGPGDEVFASTIMMAGRTRIRVSRTGAATMVAQIGKILNRTADYRTKVEARGEKLSDQAVIPLMSLGLVAYDVVGISGTLGVLSSNFTDGLRIAAPLGILNFLNRATKDGILIKDGRALELLNGIDTVVFDKTGTLTEEQPHVGDIHTNDGISADELLTYAAAADAKQSHPIARAIVQAAEERGLSLPELEQASFRVGYGVEATIAGKRIRVGSARFMEQEGIEITKEVKEAQARAHEYGYSIIFVGVDGRLGGAMELRPTVRAEVRSVVEALKARGLSLYILSGDQEHPTRHMATSLGIDHYFAEVLPNDKAAMVKKLQAEGHKVCFVGDGINDSIALKQANTSVSLSGATTVALDTAQIVMLEGNLHKLPALFELSRDFENNMRICMITNIVPSIILIWGIFYLHFSIYTAVLFYNVTFLISIANAMLPRLRMRKENLPSTEAPANL